MESCTLTYPYYNLNIFDFLLLLFFNNNAHLMLFSLFQNEWIPGPKDVAFVALNVQIGVPILYMKLCRNQLDDQPTHSTTDEQTRS